MGNVWRVFKRDVLRLLKVPPALVVVIALLILPSLYTWYNVVGFWDPYSNTGNLRVCVVNEDAGASSDLTGEVHVGDMIVDELHKNDQLDWAFVDRDTAMSQLDSGESYAAFVIPEDFSKNLLSLATGDFTQPKIQYYVNEKTGPVAPKITDTGATTLDETINATFVSTVSDAAASLLDQAIDESQVAIDASRSRAIGQISDVLAVVGDTRASLEEVSVAADDARVKVQDAKDDLGQVRFQIETASSALATASQLATQLQDELTNFSALVAPAVGDGATAVADVSAKANEVIAGMTAAVSGAQAEIEASIAHAQSMVDEYQSIAAYVRKVADALPDGAAVKDSLLALADSMDAKAEETQQTLDDLRSLDEAAGALSQSVSQTADALNEAIQASSNALKTYSDDLFGTTIPALNQSLAQLSTAAASLSASVSGQTLLVDQTELLLDQLDSTLGTAAEALGQTGGLLGSLEDGLGTVRTDLVALGTSDVLMQVLGEDGLDASKIADFMKSPTELKTESLYQPNSYGAAMAPLFMNLTFWIGAFMLVIILRQEADEEGIRNLTATQGYLGRFLLFAVFAVLQALICCAGVLVIGVEAANAVALFFAAAITSLAYLSVIYALSTTLQHIGKGLCIVLVFAQIPGATGLYPIEMTSGFFQSVYPAFPFTYGIRAMREAICGFYGAHYVSALGMLLVFFAAFMAIGLLLKPLMVNVNRMVAGQVKQSGLFNGEDVEAPARPYRFSQLFQALADKDEYREQIRGRYERFLQRYPRLIRGSVVCGIAVPVVLTFVFAFTPAEKVWILTAWLIWLVAIFVFLVVVENMRVGFERQIELGALSDEGLIELGVRSKGKHDAAVGDGATGGDAAAGDGVAAGAKPVEVAGSEGLPEAGSVARAVDAADSAKDAAAGDGAAGGDGVAAGDGAAAADSAAFSDVAKEEGDRRA